MIIIKIYNYLIYRIFMEKWKKGFKIKNNEWNIINWMIEEIYEIYYSGKLIVKLISGK
jgi:hypothetical protein